MNDASSDKLGRPVRDLRISVTDRCNFRCPYCMPAELYGEAYKFLPRADILSYEEIERLARVFAQLGVTKIRITGGEPLMRAELPSLIGRLAAIEGIDDVALTTNGILLAEHAEALARAGLNRVTVSVDSLDSEVFKKMSGREHSPQQVLAGIDAAEAAGLRPVKINCVVQRGVNDHTIAGLARLFRTRGNTLRFIEYMDVGTLNEWNLTDVVPAKEILAAVSRNGDSNPEAELVAVEPAYRGEVARRYRYKDGSNGHRAAEIGIISSVTQPFCGDCTRARISTDGRLMTCLFASEGRDLRAPLRGGASDDELRKIVAGVWGKREDRYSEFRTTTKPASKRVEMFRIGG